jgi:hypothetical protein
MLHNPVDAFVDVPISATALLAFGAGEDTRKRGCEGEDEYGGFHGGLEVGIVWCVWVLAVVAGC